MRKINTMISTIRSIYDEIGNYLPAGNYYYEVKDYSNGIFIGNVTNNQGSFGTFRFTSPDLVKMMAVAQSRLITKTNMSFEIGMPNYPVPISNPAPNTQRIRSRYVYQTNIRNNIILERNTDRTNRRDNIINRRDNIINRRDNITNRRQDTINTRQHRINRNLQNQSYNCTICMDEITRYDKKTLNCNHNFHINCINEWLRESNTCPICRAPQTINSNRIYNTENTLNSTISFLRRNRVYSAIDEIDRSYRENRLFYRHK